MNLSKLQQILLNLFFFSINFEIWDPINSGGIFSISKFSGLLFFVSLLPDIASYIRISEKHNIIRVLFLFFIYLTIINMFNINSYDNSFFNLTIFQNIFLLLLLVNFERKHPGSLNKALLTFAYGSLLLYVFYYLGFGVERTEFGGGRVSLFGDNENTIGIKMSVSIIIFWSFFKKSKYLLINKIVLYLIPIPLLFTLLLDTGSRVSLIAVFLAGLVSLFLEKNGSKLKRIIGIVLGIFLLFFTLEFVMNSELMGSRLENTMQNGALAGRDQIWSRVLPFLNDNIIFGAGTTGYTEYSYYEFGVKKSIHNVFIEVFIYTGIIGFLLYNYFIYGLLKKSYFAFKITNNTLGLLLFIPIFGLMLSGQLLNVKLGWLVFAYAASQTSKIDRLKG